MRLRSVNEKIDEKRRTNANKRTTHLKSVKSVKSARKLYLDFTDFTSPKLEPPGAKTGSSSEKGPADLSEPEGEGGRKIRLNTATRGVGGKVQSLVVPRTSPNVRTFGTPERVRAF